MVIIYRWFCARAPLLFSVPAEVSSISPGLEGDTQTALPTRSITSQPMSPLRTCPLDSVTTVKVDTGPLSLVTCPPVCWAIWLFRAAIFWSTFCIMVFRNVSFR